MSFRSLELLALALVLVSCRGDTYVTPLIVSLPDFGGGSYCIGPEGVDTLILDIFEFDSLDDPDPARGANLCSLCAIGDPAVECRHLHRVCRCTEHPLHSSEEITEALTGASFIGLDPTSALCARLVLLSRGPGAAMGEVGSSECVGLPECSPAAPIVEPPACGLSQVGFANESRTPMVINQWRCDQVLGLCSRLELLCSRGEVSACETFEKACEGGNLLITTRACAAF